jgi:N-acetylneuraminic acid mutarotase
MKNYLVNLLLATGFLAISALPAFAACTVTLTPNSIPADTNTSVHVSADNFPSTSGDQLELATDADGDHSAGIVSASVPTGCTFNYQSYLNDGFTCDHNTTTMTADGVFNFHAGYNSNGNNTHAIAFQDLTTSNFDCVGTITITAGGTPTPTPTPTPSATPTPSIPPAPANGNWESVGSMATSRNDHSATTLNDNRVLVAGGSNEGGALVNFAELYNPSTKTWSTTGNLNTPRITAFNSMVTLQNGKALLAGGQLLDNTPLASAELYDPSTGTWSYTGSLNTPRRFASKAILLDDGRVLVAGGTNLQSGGSLNTSELYNPSTGTWSYTANNMAQDRFGSSIIKLQDGRVLITGGSVGGNGGSCYNTAEIFNPATNTWSSAGTMPYAGTFEQMTVLSDGRVFVAGGGCTSDLSNSTIYNPVTNTWSSTASLPVTPATGVSFLLDNGNVLVRSTGFDSGTTVDEIYNPTTDTWTVNNAPSAHRITWAQLTNGDVLTMGGIICDPSCRLLDTAELFTTGPVVNPISNATLNEGGTYSTSGSFTDNNSNATSWSATVDYGDSSGSQSLTLNSDKTFSLSHLYKDNGTYIVTVSVTDNQGGTGTGTATVTVNNVAPSVGTITAPSSPVLVNTAMTASANFTDPGVNDTHTASWNWGDGSSTGTVTESNGSGSVSNNHTYTATGVYTITLTVTDKDGGQGTSTYQYVAVYDSSTSFAGGRSFDNPSSASPNTTGKVSFGISAKYNNSNVLTGSAKMNFKAANLDFASTSLQSLATTNGRAYLKGSGTLNGTSGYTFLASGIDGSVAGGNDLIRIQIKDSSNNVVYDSQPGAGDTADPTTTDATGNIRVH